MESASANGAVVPPVPGPELDQVDILTAATALRWSRPDLTAALAQHVMEAASALSDRDPWLLAAGWWVHAVGAVGDGREAAADILDALPRWGADALSRSSAGRLRAELAVLAHDAGESATAHALLDGLSCGGRSGDTELAADLATVRLRCRGDVVRADPAEALTAWERLGGAAGQVGAAATLLVAAVTDRRTDRAENAVARAVDGLGRLDRARPSAEALSPSPHLAAALAAEWISSLIAVGRRDQAREGSRPLRERLVEHARPTRQLALLRLTLALASVDDGPGGGAEAVRDLERAAHDAAVSDAPELERICRTALGEVHEAGGRPDAARESVRLAVVAERRHRSRTVRFLAALAATPGPGSSGSPAGGRGASAEPDADGRAARDTSGAPAPTRTEHPDADALPRAARDQAAGGRAGGGSAGMADRTAMLRAVQTASMADAGPLDGPVPGTTDRGGADRGGADRAGGERGPADPGGRSRHRSGDRTDDPDGVRAPSWGVDGSAGTGSAGHEHAADGAGTRGVTANGSAANGSTANGSGSNGSGSNGSGTNGSGTNGSGTNGAASWADRGAGNRGRRRGLDGTGDEAEDSRISGRGDVGTDRSDDDRSGSHGSGSYGQRVPGPGRSDGDARSGGSRLAGTSAADPWATGAWTPAPVPATDAAPAAAIGDPPVAPDPVLSALADPEAWLASALADLDRIWGRRPDGPDGTAGDEEGVEPPEADETSSGCVVVLDLARSGERLPAADAAPTLRRVARRLAQRLPDSAHLRRDSPDALSVLLGGDDRAAAAEWMHRVVPALVDGLAVDAVVEGAHLRAAVHDVQGVVGAQVLQRLDGVRSRTPHGGVPGRARHAAPGRAAPGGAALDEGVSGDPVSATPVAGHAPGNTTIGSATGWAATGWAATGWAVNRWAVNARDAAARQVSHEVSAGDAVPDGGPRSGRPDSGSRTSLDGAQATADGSGPASAPASEPPAPGRWSAGRQDEAGGRRPYLPDGVVVRPGTGGRRHRRSPDPLPDEPTREATPVGPQSTEGLGLADLLAGALAAYRSI